MNYYQDFYKHLSEIESIGLFKDAGRVIRDKEMDVLRFYRIKDEENFKRYIEKGDGLDSGAHPWELNGYKRTVQPNDSLEEFFEKTTDHEKKQTPFFDTRVSSASRQAVVEKMEKDGSQHGNNGKGGAPKPFKYI